MRWPGPVATLAICVLLALAAPSSASAHLRTGTVAVGYEATVSLPSPSTSGPFAVGVYASDLAVHLTVRAGHTVVVLGYLGEPFLRLGPAGVAVNTGSPTAAATGLLGKGGKAGSGHGWLLQRGRDSAVWHDLRVSRLRAGARSSAWRIPILVDGRRSGIVGQTRRLPAPDLVPWLGLVAAFAALAVAVALSGPPSRLAATCAALAALAGIAAIATAAGFVFDAYASPGTWIFAVDETAFILAAAAGLVWAPSPWRIAGGVVLGFLGLATGLSKLPVLLDADVLSVVPGDVTRLLVAVSIGAGAAAAGLGGLWLTRRENDAFDQRADLLSAVGPRAGSE